MKYIIGILFFYSMSLSLAGQGELKNVSSVDEMARFVSCEEMKNVKMRDMCAKKNLYEFIYDRLDYPAEAKSKRIQGTVVVQLKINNQGKITNLKVLKQPDARLGDAAVEALEHMPNWIPGKNNGVAVESLVNVPIEFKL